jgi:hypothetical protein
VSKRDRMNRRQWTSPFVQKSLRPVDPQLFLACTHVYQAAARFQLVVENPQERKFAIDGTVYGFTDTPMNRGMLATMDFLREQRSEFGPAVCSRLMAMGLMFETARNDKRFSEFFKDESDDGSVMVAECFMAACGQARFVERTLDLDPEDVLKIANRLAALDPPTP